MLEKIDEKTMTDWLEGRNLPNLPRSNIENSNTQSTVSSQLEQTEDKIVAGSVEQDIHEEVIGQLSTNSVDTFRAMHGGKQLDTAVAAPNDHGNTVSSSSSSVESPPTRKSRSTNRDDAMIKTKIHNRRRSTTPQTTSKQKQLWPPLRKECMSGEN